MKMSCCVGFRVMPPGLIKWRMPRNDELKENKRPVVLLCGRWGQPGGVGGEGLALHRNRCLNGFCRWFYASSWWALWQIFPSALLVQSRLEVTLCISAGSMCPLTLPIFLQFTLKNIFIYFLSDFNAVSFFSLSI